MDWLTLVSAIGLLLVFEGVLPFASPQRFRSLMQAMSVQSDIIMRVIGVSSMLLGLLIVSLAHYLFD